MTTIKIDRNGASQSVQLPDGFQFDVDEVEILRRGDEVVLRKKRTNLREAFDLDLIDIELKTIGQLHALRGTAAIDLGGGHGFLASVGLRENRSGCNRCALPDAQHALAMLA